MPKKKGPTQISMRLKPAEVEQLDARRKALPGVPVSRNTYAKHVVTSFPNIVERLQNALKDEDGMTPHSSAIKEFSRDLLREAGL